MTDEHDADHENPPLLDEESSDDESSYDGSSYDGDDGSAYEGGSRRGARRRNVPGCIAVLVALAVVAGGIYVAATWAIDKLGDQFSSAEDYPGARQRTRSPSRSRRATRWP